MGENEILLRRWFEEVWNKGHEVTIDEMCHEQAIGTGQAQPGATIRGPEDFKRLWRNIRAAFSEIHIELDDIIEQGDRVVARWTMVMVHTGPFLGISPTKKRVTVTGISIQRYAHGQIVAGWDNWDQLGLLVQLGAVPEPKLL